MVWPNWFDFGNWSRAINKEIPSPFAKASADLGKALSELFDGNSLRLHVDVKFILS